MPDREKVISRLENWRETCPFEKCAHCGAKGKCTNPIFDDVLALLKEQEPRVMMVSEFIEQPLVWLEDKDKTEVIPALFMRFSGWNVEFARQRRKQDDEPAIVRAAEHGYGEYWRAWTSRPSPEQMRETPWEGDNDE